MVFVCACAREKESERARARASVGICVPYTLTPSCMYVHAFIWICTFDLYVSVHAAYVHAQMHED